MKMLAAPTIRRIMHSPYAAGRRNTSYEVGNFSDQSSRQ
jgi:hypothetical protein